MTPDKDALQVVEDAWTRSWQAQNPRNGIYQRIWQRYKGFNPDIDDPYRSAIVMPKVYSVVETMAPRLAKALFGSKPYIRLSCPLAPEMAQNIQDVVNHYLYLDKFRATGTAMCKAVSLFGTWFLEPIPYAEETEIVTVSGTDSYPWQAVPETKKQDKFRIKIHPWAPWQVYVEPNMITMSDSGGYVITVDIVPVAEIERMIAEGVYSPINGDYITAADQPQRDFAKSMMTSLGIAFPAENATYGIRMKYRSKDRYITTWNGLVTLKDGPNPYNHKGTNLVRCVCNLDPMLQNSFWGQGEGKVIEILCDKLDESYNHLFNDHDMITNGAISYVEDAVDPEDIVMVGGIRIKVNKSFHGSRDEAVGPMNLPHLPPEAYAIPETLDNWVDKASGIWDIQRGEPGKQAKTATEASLLSTQGDLRSECKINLLETLCLSELSDICCSHIDQFAPVRDITEIIGQERASQMFSADPKKLPGGYQYEFKGADSIINDFQRRSDWAEVMKAWAGSPYVRPGAIERKSAEIYGLDEHEIDEMLMTPEEIATANKLMMMMQKMGGGNQNPENTKQLTNMAERGEPGMQAPTSQG